MVFLAVLGYAATILVSFGNYFVAFQICRSFSLDPQHIKVTLYLEYSCTPASWAAWLTAWYLYSILLAWYMSIVMRPRTFALGPLRCLASRQFRNAAFEYTVEYGWLQNVMLAAVYVGLFMHPWEKNMERPIRDWQDRLHCRAAKLPKWAVIVAAMMLAVLTVEKFAWRTGMPGQCPYKWRGALPLLRGVAVTLGRSLKGLAGYVPFAEAIKNDWRRGFVRLSIGDNPEPGDNRIELDDLTSLVSTSSDDGDIGTRSGTTSGGLGREGDRPNLPDPLHFDIGGSSEDSLALSY